jgi:hypothetical protein
LGVMVAAERRERLQADERGRAAVRTWDGLEREYEAAGKVYEWDAQREVGTRMEAFARALKLAPELEGVLRERGRALGSPEGRGWTGGCGRRRSTGGCCGGSTLTTGRGCAPARASQARS